MRCLAPPLAAAIAFSACSGTQETTTSFPPSLPQELRADYEVFAVRCSKCHSLSRPLDSGITDDEFWARYVERMRLQPASGIAKEDTPAILRYLHYYSAELRRKQGG